MKITVKCIYSEEKIMWKTEFNQIMTMLSMIFVVVVVTFADAITTGGVTTINFVPDASSK